jgi:hypothetical protein
MREQSGSVLRGLASLQQSTEFEIQSDVPLQDSSRPILVEVPSLGGLLTSQLSGSLVVAATVSEEVLTFVPPISEVGSSSGVNINHVDSTLDNVGTGCSDINFGFTSVPVGSTFTSPVSFAHPLVFGKVPDQSNVSLDFSPRQLQVEPEESFQRAGFDDLLYSAPVGDSSVFPTPSLRKCKK